MAECMRDTLEDAGPRRSAGRRSRTGGRTCVGRLEGAGGGPSLMFNGHMDTSYSGREPHLRAKRGFQPQRVRARRTHLGPRDLEHEGRARLLRRGRPRGPATPDVTLAGDIVIAAVVGEIEKTQWGEEFRGGEYRGYAAGSRYLADPRRDRRHVHPRRADRAARRARPLRRDVGADLDARARSSTPRSPPAGSRENSIVRMQERARRRARVDPRVGASAAAYGGHRRRRQHRLAARRRSRGASAARRTAPTCSSTSACRRRWRCRTPRDALRRARAWRCASATPTPGSVRGLRDRARRRDRRGPSADRRDRRRPRAGVRRAARARRRCAGSRTPRRSRATGSRPSTTAPPAGCPDPDGENLDDRGPARHRHGLRARRREICGAACVKLVTFDDRRRRTRGRALIDGRADRRHRRFPTCATLFERGVDPATVARGAASSSRSRTCALRAPIIPKKFFHTSGNFREHEEESKVVGWSHEIAPWIVFFQNVDAIIGPDEPIVYPEHLTDELDYELELAIVIIGTGRQALRRAARPRTTSAATLIFNDITARDIQRREMRSGVFSFCKAIDTFCPLGPWIVTARRDRRPARPRHGLRVNGELRQESALGQHVGDDPADHRPLLGARLQPRRHRSRPAPSRASPASARTPPRCTCARATWSNARSSGSARCATR